MLHVVVAASLLFKVACFPCKLCASHSDSGLQQAPPALAALLADAEAADQDVKSRTEAALWAVGTCLCHLQTLLLDKCVLYMTSVHCAALLALVSTAAHQLGCL